MLSGVLLSVGGGYYKLKSSLSACHDGCWFLNYCNTLNPTLNYKIENQILGCYPNRTYILYSDKVNILATELKI